MRSRTLEGYWWLPGREDNKIPGILTYDGTEPSVRLLGAFTYHVEQSPGVFTVETTQQAPLILGAADGEAVTLVDCRQRRFSVKWGMTKDWLAVSAFRRPHDDGGKWPHLGRLEDQVTEVSGPTRDTPGVV